MLVDTHSKTKQIYISLGCARLAPRTQPLLNVLTCVIHLDLFPHQK